MKDRNLKTDAKTAARHFAKEIAERIVTTGTAPMNLLEYSGGAKYHETRHHAGKFPEVYAEAVLDTFAKLIRDINDGAEWRTKLDGDRFNVEVVSEKIKEFIQGW